MKKASEMKPENASKDLFGLNAVGKPYGPSYDPKYKRKTKLTDIRRLYTPFIGPVPYVGDARPDECSPAVDE